MLIRLSSFSVAAFLTFGVGPLALGISSAVVMKNGGAKVSSEEARSVGIAQHAALRPQKRTSSALYLTSEQAHNWLEDDPDILFVDVRDPLEASLMGHPKHIDAIVPVRVFSDQFDPLLGEYELVDNPEFTTQMDEVLAMFGRTKSQDIIVICGSGWRSATAVRRLAEQGYSKVWHITDGYPGEEKVGMNSDHAWRIAGLPWTTTDIVPGSTWHSLFCTSPGSGLDSCKQAQ